MPNRSITVRSKEVWHLPYMGGELTRKRKWFVSMQKTDHFWFTAGDPTGYRTWRAAMREANFMARINGN